ncbi:MAG: FAD-dependent oxidoreductase [Candidatus Sumerlaeota bacterium]|nr:FAD-dependent oxidoreductase [Candidatus Sumerlaeota bacterium]
MIAKRAVFLVVKWMARMARALLLLSGAAAFAADDITADVCVYGATPAGIVAAVAAKQEGASVALIEPSRWLGGMLGAGIKPKQDCADEKAVGGLTKTKVFVLGNTPPAIREGFAQWLRDERIPVVCEYRVKGVEKDGSDGRDGRDGKTTRDGRRIARLRLEYAPPDEMGVPAAAAKDGPGKTVAAKVFIDASYEGDLMAAAGVRYAVGREPGDKFHEKPAGVGPPVNWTPIDPYVKPGDAQSGLLPLLDPDHGKPVGAGDDFTQAYNFRFYITTDSAKRAPFTKPDGYDPSQFELVGRYVEYIVKDSAGDARKTTERLRGIFPGWLNQGEYNYQRKSLVSIAPLGLSRYYQDGDWPARSKVWRQHIDYLRGLQCFMSSDPRVPEDFRKQVAAMGLDKTMHPDTQGWPNQLYVRIARRMEGPYILTHADVFNQTQIADGVGLALYGVDTYPARRYAVRDPKADKQDGATSDPQSGKLGVAVEGNMFLGGARGTGHPYPVPYRALTPIPEECSNLLVPVCFSASYIAYASARMEPVFCVLGESAGVAAAQAAREAVTVQALDIKKLQSRLIERGQVLIWKPSAAK